MKETRLKPVSDKRKAELKEYRILEDKLREDCGNVSELSGRYGDWRTYYNVEAHHITGRYGKRLLDPFNIIMITRGEHDTIKRTHTDEELLARVRKLRIEQGFKDGNGGKAQ